MGFWEKRRKKERIAHDFFAIAGGPKPQTGHRQTVRPVRPMVRFGRFRGLLGRGATQKVHEFDLGRPRDFRTHSENSEVFWRRIDKSSNELICAINFKPTLLSHRLHRSTPDMVWLNPKSRFKFMPEINCLKSSKMY